MLRGQMSPAAALSPRPAWGARGERVKIALVGPAYPFRGGIAHYTDLLSAHLTHAHSVRVYSFQQQFPGWLFPGRSQFEPGPGPTDPAETVRWLVPWWPLSWVRVTDDWARWGAELIVFQWWVPYMAPMTAWLVRAAARRSLPTVAICHNVLPHERGRLDVAAVRLALGHIGALLVHSSPDAHKAHNLLPGKPVRTVPMPRYGFRTSRPWTREEARAKLAIGGRTLLFFGFVRPYKGLLDLLEAMPAVVKNCKASLLVVGEIWGNPELYHQRVRQLGLEHHVSFVDRYVPPNDEAAAYFAAADLAVLPYRDATGSGAAQLALAAGVPVVATRAGGLADAIDDGVTGFLVEPGDVAGLAAAIERFFVEERAADFRRAIQDQHQRFSWSSISQAVQDLAAVPRA